MSAHKIVIPDIHQQIFKLDILLDCEDFKTAEEVIFLGDYFDSFDQQDQFEDTVTFLNDNAGNPRYTFLMGNHDIHYLSTNKAYRCSGYSSNNHEYIKTNLSKEFRDKIKLYDLKKIAGESVLFSHAGFHPSHFTVSTDATKHDSLVNFFDSLDIDINLNHPLLHAGEDRGGRQYHGGILWCDWYSLELIAGLSQVVGHTQHIAPQVMSYAEMTTSCNINIDTNLDHYLKIHLETNEWKVVGSLRDISSFGNRILRISGVEYRGF